MVSRENWLEAYRVFLLQPPSLPRSVSFASFVLADIVVSQTKIYFSTWGLLEVLANPHDLWMAALSQEAGEPSLLRVAGRASGEAAEGSFSGSVGSSADQEATTLPAAVSGLWIFHRRPPVTLNWVQFS